MKKLVTIFQLLIKLNLIKSLYYSLRFRGRVYVGKGKIFIEGNGRIDFLSPKSSLYIGVYHTVAQPTTLTLMRNARMIVGSNVMIHRGAKIVVHEGGELQIGEDTYINELARVHCKKRIVIGKNCAIAWNTNILDTDLHYIYDESGKQMNTEKDIHIGNDVWIGANSTILKGTYIEDNCIIAAHSIAKGELHSNYIYGGNPIKQLKPFTYWQA